MQKKRPREQKPKQRRRRKPEKLFGLTTPLRINVLTGTPITPGGSTSIYDILYTRKDKDLLKEEIEKLKIPLQQQTRREALIHDTGIIKGFASGLKGVTPVINPDAPYQLIIKDIGGKSSTRPIRIQVGFLDYMDAADHIGAYMGSKAPSIEEILRQVSRKDGVTVNNMNFKLYKKTTTSRLGKDTVRWRYPPKLYIEPALPPPDLPPYAEKPYFPPELSPVYPPEPRPVKPPELRPVSAPIRKKRPTKKETDERV
jgi:hypothetical protein